MVLMSEPTIATPRAPPTCLVTSFIADATPALAGGTDPITESVAGAITEPIARRSTNNERTVSYTPHPPTCLVTSFIADATPASAGGTDPITESVAGAITEPIARPSTNNQRTISQTDCAGVQKTVAERTSASRTMPTATTRFVPNLVTRRLLVVALSISPIARGIIVAPALSAL